MIPNEKERKVIEVEMRQLANIPEDYTVMINIQPYLMYDFGYRVYKSKKVVELCIYSAWYPNTYTEHKKVVADEIKEKMGW